MRYEPIGEQQPEAASSAETSSSTHSRKVLAEVYLVFPGLLIKLIRLRYVNVVTLDSTYYRKYHNYYKKLSFHGCVQVKKGTATLNFSSTVIWRTQFHKIHKRASSRRTMADLFDVYPDASTASSGQHLADGQLANRKNGIAVEKRRALEENLKKEVSHAANNDLSRLLEQRNARRKARHETHLQSEQALAEEVNNALDSSKVWDVIAKLSDTTQDNALKKTSDLTRMRKLMIALKNEPLESTRGF